LEVSKIIGIFVKKKQMKKIKIHTLLPLMLFALLFLVGCHGDQTLGQSPKRKFSLTLYNVTGYNLVSSVVDCDSFQMVSTKRADIWVDGTKMSIQAEDVIYPKSNF
jgi:hypothetical protein